MEARRGTLDAKSSREATTGRGAGRGGPRSGAFNCIHHDFCHRPDAGGVGVLLH